MRFVRYTTIFAIMLLSSCAGKIVTKQDSSIRTVQKLRIGMVELSSNSFNVVSFSDCMKNYPGNELILDRQTRYELDIENWHSDNLITSLKNQNYQDYDSIKNFSLLLLLFKNKDQKSFVRLINFLSKQVRTLSIDPGQFTCENILSTARALVVDSIPPYADVYLNDRKIGEAPIWTSLNDGTYDISCKLPEDVFPKKTLSVPGTIQYFCKRENLSMSGIENERENETSEKSQSWFLYGLMGILSVGSAILPFFLF